MAKAVSVNADLIKRIQACTGVECKDSASIRNALTIMLNRIDNKDHMEADEKIEQKSPTKVKGKIEHSKHMSVEHPKQDISAIVKAEVEKITKGTTQTPEAKPHEDDLKHMSSDINFLECKNCGKMENPKGMTKKFKSCPDCGANTVHPQRKTCPFCGSEHGEDEWEDGIELEDE